MAPQIETNGSGVKMPLRDIIIVLALAVSIGGGFWSVVQTQFNAQKEREDLIASYSEKIGKIVTSQAKERDDELQQQLDRRIPELERIVLYLRDQLERTRENYTPLRELLHIEQEIKVIEQTRPTTGELQAIGNGNREQITKLEERVRSLEDNLRRVPIKTTP